MAPALELKGITKRFPSVLANDNIDLSVERGEIHALMGENGAGKSTLMSILYGVYQPDAGEIIVDNSTRHFASPVDAIGAGLGMVFQSFQLFESMTVTENVIFRAEPVKHGQIDRKAARARVIEIAERYGLAVDADARVDTLPVGVLQRVEIIKALYRRAQVLILDEPTAVLTPQERDRLFEVLRRLAADGRTIIFITHKLKEVLEVSDRVTVLRDGRAVARLVTAETSETEITKFMTGRDVVLDTVPAGPEPGPPTLECVDLTVRMDERDVVSQVSLEVRSGEIVGVAGVAGNGQSELAEVLAGLAQASAGRVRLVGADITELSTYQRRMAGLAYIPEDRHNVGSAGPASIRDNLLMGYQRRPRFRPRFLLDRRVIAQHARTLIDRFSIKVPSIDTPVATLSGGNLQKVIVAREMATEAKLLIAEQPTRGIDIGAIEFVHQQLIDYRDAGGAVLLISAELSEVMRLSNRIVVMFEGRIVAEVTAAEATESQLGLWMAGGSEAVAAGPTSPSEGRNG